MQGQRALPEGVIDLCHTVRKPVRRHVSCRHVSLNRILLSHSTLHPTGTANARPEICEPCGLLGAASRGIPSPLCRAGRAFDRETEWPTNAQRCSFPGRVHPVAKAQRPGVVSYRTAMCTFDDPG